MTRQVRKEKEITWTGSIALPTASEYLRTNSNVEQCGTYGDNNTNALSCKATTWMYGLVPPGGYLWTVSANQYTSGVVTVIYASSSHDGEIRDYNLTSKGSAYAPTLYLVSDVTLSGSGTSDNPYIIK